jgi:GNAT superfamily N-acetyltransferase
MEKRLLNADDAGEWLRLRLEALRTDPGAFSASLEEYESLSLTEVKSRLWSGTDAFVVGAFEHGQLVGKAGFYREKAAKSRHKGRVWGVYVTASKRGHGIGRRLMQDLLERARRIHGIEQLLLSVTGSQAAALRLYESLGFKTFGTEPRALRIRDKYIDEHYLMLDLRKATSASG